MDDWPELTIGEVARRAGVAPSAIRYYESIGLLPEPERESGQRRYEESVIGKLAFVGVAQSAGFSLEEIKELVEASTTARGWLHRCDRFPPASSTRSRHCSSAPKR